MLRRLQTDRIIMRRRGIRSSAVGFAGILGLLAALPLAAADEDRPGSAQWVSAQQLSDLRDALAPHGWQVYREDDGGLIVFRQQPPEPPEPPQPLDAKPAFTPPAGQPAMLGLIKRLRAAGWQAQEAEDGGLLNSAGCVPGQVLRLQHAIFRSGSARLSAQAKIELAGYAQVLARHPGLQVLVLGHTDSLGSAHSNQYLSRLRANSVRNYLLTQGLSAERVKAEGRGEAEPVADNATAEGRRQNRRVELSLHASP